MKIYFRVLSLEDRVNRNDLWSTKPLDEHPVDFCYFTNREHSYCWRTLEPRQTGRLYRDLAATISDKWKLYRPIKEPENCKTMDNPNNERKIELDL